MLAYVATVVAVITLAPFRFVGRPDHGLSLEWTPVDLVMNVAMFLPLGFLWRVARPGLAQPVERAFLLGALGSATIELVQLFEPARYSSAIDVLTNATGMALGALCFDRIGSRLEPSRAVRSLALELPVMGLVYLLLPLAWLAGLAALDQELRGVLLLPIGATAGAILGSVHGGYREPLASAGGSLLSLATAAALWTVVALLPTGTHDVMLSAGVLATTIGAATLRSIATSRLRASAGNGVDKRFELPTLRLALPLFAAYLALSSLWPFDVIARSAEWQGGLSLLPTGTPLSQAELFRILEHTAAFTVAGYVAAEYHGRDVRRYRDAVSKVLGWCMPAAVLLELLRGWHPRYGASGALLALATGAGMFGGWLYVLQRDHVRAIIAERRH